MLLHDGQAEKAYVLLHEVLPHYRQLPAEEKARFGLLYFIALDKTFKSLQPEELIRFSAEYYRRHGQYALFLTSSTCHPKFICEQWRNALMAFHQHSSADCLLVLRQCNLYSHYSFSKFEHLVHTHIYAG